MSKWLFPWLAFSLCCLLAAVFATDPLGQYLLLGMAAGSLLLLGIILVVFRLWEVIDWKRVRWYVKPLLELVESMGASCTILFWGLYAMRSRLLGVGEQWMVSVGLGCLATALGCWVVRKVVWGVIPWVKYRLASTREDRKRRKANEKWLRECKRLDDMTLPEYKAYLVERRKEAERKGREMRAHVGAWLGYPVAMSNTQPHTASRDGNGNGGCVWGVKGGGTPVQVLEG